MPRVRVATQSAAKVKGLVGGAVFGGGTEGASGPTDDRLGAQGTPVAAVGIGQAHFSVYGRLGEWGRLWSAGHAVLAGMLMLFQTAWQPRRGGAVCGRGGMQSWPACSCLPRLHGSLGGVGSPEVGACGSGRHAHAFSGCMAAREGHGPHHPQA